MSSDSPLLDLLKCHNRAARSLDPAAAPDEVLARAAVGLVETCGDPWAVFWRVGMDEVAELLGSAGLPEPPPSCPIDVIEITGEVGAWTRQLAADQAGPWAVATGSPGVLLTIIRVGQGPWLILGVGTDRDPPQGTVEVKLGFTQALAAMLATAELAERERRARADVEAQGRRFFRLLDSSPALVMLMRGKSHRVEFINRALHLETMGQRVLGRPFADGFTRIAAQGIAELLDDARARGGPVRRTEVPLRLRGSSGEVTRYFDVVIQGLGRDGPRDGMMLHAVDVSDKVRARNALEGSRTRFVDLVESIDGVVWETDAAFQHYTFLSKQTQRLWELDPGTVRSPQQLDDRFDSDDLRSVRSIREIGLGTRRNWEVEYRWRTASGSWRWLGERARVLLDEDGEISAVRGLTVDVTERREAQLERERIQRHLQESQRLESMGLLAGGIAHDFNNLLTAMMGNASLALARLPPDAPAAPQIEALVNASQRASELTRQMLAYSGRGQFVVETTRVGPRIQEFATLLEAALPKRVALKLDLAPDLPLVKVDVAQFQQLVMNLVINASESFNQGGGEVRVTTRPATLSHKELADFPGAADLAPGAYVRISVSDTGQGMDATTVQRIFDPFFSRKVGGSGLGLAAVQGIVRGHNGVITVKSALGAGTTFSAYLPVAGEHEEPTPAPSVRPPPLSTAETPSHGGGQALIVDDELAVRATLRVLLEHFGFQVIDASDGHQGLALHEAYGPELRLVVLDLTMPGIRGEEVFERLRKRDPLLPVIVSSGYSASDVEETAFTRGPTVFLEKPYTAEELDEALFVVLRKAARLRAK